MGQYDVIVIGAGQSGLAIGYYLKRQGRKFVILDGARHTLGSGTLCWVKHDARWPATRIRLKQKRKMF